MQDPRLAADPDELFGRAGDAVARYLERDEAGLDGSAYAGDAASLYERSLAALPPNDPRAPVFGYNLALALQYRYDAVGASSGDTTDLRTASSVLDTARSSVDGGDGDHSLKAVLAYGHGLVMRRLFAAERAPTDVRLAVSLFRDALTASDRSRLDVADCYYEYGRALLDAADVDDEPASLTDTAIRVLEALVEAVDPTTTDFPAYLAAAGSARMARFDLLRQEGDLQVACKLAEAAVACQRSRGHVSAEALSNLAAVLDARSAGAGARSDDLDRAVDLSREAISLIPEATNPGGLDLRAGLMSNHVAFSLHRIEQTGKIDGIDPVVALADQSVRETPSGTLKLGTRAHQAAVAHRTRYLRMGDTADLTEALRLHRLALHAPVSASDRLTIIDSFGSTWRTRFDLTHDTSDLRRAIRAYETAVDETTSDSPDRAARLNNLGAAQAALADLTHDDQDANRASRTLEEAIRLGAPASLERTRALINLGNVSADRFARSGAPALRQTASHAYEEVRDSVGRLGQGTEPLLQAALNAAELAEDASDWPAVISWSETALDAVDDLLVLQSERRSKESWLRLSLGAADRAAWAAVVTGDFPKAVFVVERGRASLLKAAVDQNRLDLDKLGQVGGAELRHQVEAARAVAQGAGTTAFWDSAGGPGPSLRTLRDKIREVPGFDTFLRPMELADIVEAAGDRPLVYVCPGREAGFALVVRTGAVEHVNLPELTVDAVRDRASELFEAHALYTDPRQDPVARRKSTAAWHGALDSVGEWLGQSWGAPVVALLHEGPLIIVAGGLSSMLPLHAAWWPDQTATTGRVHVLDRLDVSYVPSAAALVAARRTAAERATDARVVTIAAPRPTRLPPLPGAATEADLAGLGQERTIRLQDVTASTDRLATALAECWLLHAACHGVADIGEPLRSGLVLAKDQRFTLARLLETNARIRIAVLSACESARIATSLPDEVVSLPSGLIQAGTAGVVASSWAVPDGVTLALMAQFYWVWRHDSGKSPASALAQAQAWVRDTTNREKLSVWEGRVKDGELPETVHDALLDVYLLREPDVLEDAVMGAWASFTHVGV